MGGKRKPRKGRLIALSGASHSGKTTALNEIMAHFGHDVDYFGENIRELIPHGMTIDQLRAQPNEYVNVMHAAILGKIRRENDALEEDRVTIFDRSLADSLYYFTRYLNVNDLNSDGQVKYYEILGSLMESITRDRYDLVVFFNPIDVPAGHNDPHRPDNLAQIQQSEFVAVRMLVTMFQPVLVVDRKSTTVKTVINTIDNML